MTKYAFFAGGQSNMLLMQDDLDAALQAYYGPETLLIRGAVAGSTIASWQKGQPNYDAAVAACLAAIADGFVIKAGLFNQGENDTFDVNIAVTWGTQYGKFIDDFRVDIGVPYMPFIHAVLGKVPTDPAGPARPGWLTVQRKQIEVLLNRASCDRVDLFPFGPYVAGAPWCHYADSPTGYQGITGQFMRYLTGRVPKAV